MPKPPEPNPKLPFTVLHADHDILVVDKPAGQVSEPGIGHRNDSLLNAAFTTHGKWLNNLGEERDWGLLHRLDKPTSGAMVLALKIDAYARLREQFENQKIDKQYLAVASGHPRTIAGVCQAPLAEVRVGNRKLVRLRPDGQRAITAWSTLATSPQGTLVLARPKTGRLHQVRAHLAHIGCPLLGDELYDRSRGAGTRPTPNRVAARSIEHAKKLLRQRSIAGNAPRPAGQWPLMLHSWKLSFIHPSTQHRVSYTAPVPLWFLKAAKRAGLDVTGALPSDTPDPAESPVPPEADA